MLSGGFFAFTALIMQFYQTYYNNWQLLDTTTGKQIQALKEFSTNKFDQELKSYISGSPMQLQMKGLIRNYKIEKEKEDKKKEVEKSQQVQENKNIS